MTIAFISSLRAAYAHFPFVGECTSRKLLFIWIFYYVTSLISLFAACWAALTAAPVLLIRIAQSYPWLNVLFAQPIMMIFLVMLINFVVFAADIKSAAAAVKNQPLLGLLSSKTRYRVLVELSLFARTFFDFSRVPILAAMLVCLMIDDFGIHLAAILLWLLFSAAALFYFLHNIRPAASPAIWLNPVIFAAAFLIILPIRDFIQETLFVLLTKWSIGSVPFHLNAVLGDHAAFILLGLAIMIFFLPPYFVKQQNNFSYMKKFKHDIAVKSLSDISKIASPAFYFLSGAGLSLLNHMSETKASLAVAFVLLMYPALFLLPNCLRRLPDFFEIKFQLTIFLWSKHYALLMIKMMTALALYAAVRLAALYLLVLYLAWQGGWLALALLLIVSTFTALILFALALQLAGLAAHREGMHSAFDLQRQKTVLTIRTFIEGIMWVIWLPLLTIPTSSLIYGDISFSDYFYLSLLLAAANILLMISLLGISVWQSHERKSILYD